MTHAIVHPTIEEHTFFSNACEKVLSQEWDHQMQQLAFRVDVYLNQAPTDGPLDISPHRHALEFLSFLFSIWSKHASYQQYLLFLARQLGSA